MEFVVKYWAQLAVLIAVIGYALKGWWDFRIKKLEIKYDLVFKERLSSIANYFHSLKEVDSVIGGLLLGIVEGDNIHNRQVDELISAANTYKKAFNYVILLIPVYISNYIFEINDAINDLEFKFHNLFDRSLQEKLDLNTIREVEKFSKEKSELIHKNSIVIVDYLHKEFNIK